MKVFKFSFPDFITNQIHTIDVPHGARFLSVQVQENQPVVYAICDPKARRVVRTFIIVTTGADIPVYSKAVDLLQYLGTAMIDGGDFVVHVFLKLS